MSNQSKHSMEESHYLRARKRLDEIKKFYRHLFIYVVINLLISGLKIRGYMQDGDTFMEALNTFDVYVVWLVWGFFVIVQAVRTFKTNVFLGADWEERKIKEFMNEK